MKAVFLDRDGVLNAPVIRNGLPFPPAEISELTILPGVPEACTALREAGFVLIGATNQPDIARGVVSRRTVEEMNGWLSAELGLAEIVMCPHDDRDGCICRKPKPGMLTEAAARMNIDLSRSCMIGDRWRDIEAGKAAGSRTVFIDWGYDERRPSEPDLIVGSLAEAVDWVKANV
jgi:D-glycero-D-manno-heptose 1,7-bisphosphate phosphatase